MRHRPLFRPPVVASPRAGMNVMNVNRLVLRLVAVVVVGTGSASGAADAAPPATARITGEWNPGVSAADAGGRPTVDGYGVGGLGVYTLTGADGTEVHAVCVQADVGHSPVASYALDGVPAVASPELDYLLWRYAGGGVSASDAEAAALNVLAWRYAGAQRSGGGPVWTGAAVEVAVTGHGRRGDIEAAVAALADEAAARRGPWAMSEPVVTVGPDATTVAVRVSGPGGPIGDVAVALDAGGEHLDAVTDADGMATVRFSATVSGRVRATAVGPGPLRTYSAPGSQRLAVPAPGPLVVEVTVMPPTTTTTTTSTTSVPATTTTTTTTATTTTTSPATTTTTMPTTTAPTVPATSTTTATTATVPATSSSTTTVPVTTPTTTAPMPPRPGPPTLPQTGAGGTRALARGGAWLFAVGGVLVLASARGVRRAGTARGAG